MNDLIRKLRAVAEPTRLRLLALCVEGEFSVTELCQVLGQSQPRVSRHLKILCDAGLLERSNEGTSAYFRVVFSGPGADLAQHLLASIPERDETLARDRDKVSTIRTVRARRAKDFVLRISNRDEPSRALEAKTGEIEDAVRALVLDRPVQRLLDIGTGTGRVLEVLGSNVGVGVGIDRSREMLAVARVKLEDAGLNNCRVRYGDLYELPFDAETFDAATVQHVLRFTNDPKAAIGEAARVLAPGAAFVVIDLAAAERAAQGGEPDYARRGFLDIDMDYWFRSAGLRPVNSLKVPGGTETVGIWQGIRDRMGAATYS
jgi:ArsR family transcriptional regulator